MLITIDITFILEIGHDIMLEEISVIYSGKMENYLVK